MNMQKVKKIKIDEMIQKWNDSHPEKRAITREILAEKVGISYGSIHNLESGKVGKSIQVLAAIAENLECDINDLIEKS